MPNREHQREGSLEAPERHPLNWKDPEFYNEQSLLDELERVFEICHGCRRCFSLCNAFPSLFDLIDESESMELDGVAKKDYWGVVDHCYLCDMCFMTKCPYVPPHPWNVDFPHLMLRAKAVKTKTRKPKLRDRLLSSTDALGKLVSVPVIAPTANAVNGNKTLRKGLEQVAGIHHAAWLPRYDSKPLRRRVANRQVDPEVAQPTESTRGRVALFSTCYGNFNEPGLGADLIAIFEHNGIPVTRPDGERCCGMPKLELGDLEAVEKFRRVNVRALLDLVSDGWDVVAPIPSCVLMFKQELPLLFPDDGDVLKVKEAMYDPFEYLMLRHKAGKLKTDFKTSLGRVSYHVACHLRVQNIGLKTRDVLQLVQDTEVTPIERCSGHNGTYAVKREFHDISVKIGKPVANRVRDAQANYFTSDCPMAGHHINGCLGHTPTALHPLALLRKAYGI